MRNNVQAVLVFISTVARRWCLTGVMLNQNQTGSHVDDGTSCSQPLMP